MKAIYIYCTFFALIGSIQVSFGQFTYFGKSGTVSYDKTMYMKNILKKQFIEKAEPNAQKWFEGLVSQVPDNAVLKKELKFKNDETLFLPAKQDMDQQLKDMIMQLALDFDAITLTNLSNNEYNRYNDFVGQKMLVKDTIKHVTWKITDEYREISGYNCRRANGITADSTYVIAFYANEIPIDGGPESISGLPGLILGLVVPSQHVSYFATKVEFSDAVVLDKKPFENTKIKRMTRVDLDKMLTESLGKFMDKETVKYVVKLALL